jgi:hypothetical protein
MLYNNNYLLIHGIEGDNPMTTEYHVYSFDLENKKEKRKKIKYYEFFQ